VVVGSGGLIVRWDGTSWKTVVSGTTNTLNGVYINNSPRFYYVVGSSGYIARADASLAFMPQTKNVPPAPNPNTTFQTFYAVGGSSYTNLFATSYSGVIYRTTDGATWNQVLPIPNTEQYNVVYQHPSTGRVYIGGSNGSLIYYSGRAVDAAQYRHHGVVPLDVGHERLATDVDRRHQRHHSEVRRNQLHRAKDRRHYSHSDRLGQQPDRCLGCG
jgi:hypothetical protein